MGAEKRHRTITGVCVCVRVFVARSQRVDTNPAEALKSVRSLLPRHERASLGRCKPNLLGPAAASPVLISNSILTPQDVQ